MTQEQITELNSLLEKSNFASALIFIRSALLMTPDDADLMRAESRMLALLGNYEESRNVADALIKSSPREIKNYHVRALPESILGRYEAELFYTEKALDIDPCDARAQTRKLTILLLLGRFTEAIAYFEAGDFPNDYLKSANNLGLAYLEQGEFAKAEKMLLRSLNINGGVAQTHYNLMRTYWYTDRRIAAAAHAIKFLWRRIASVPSFSKRPSAQIPDASLYSGSGTLYTSNPLAREAAAIFKLLRGPNFWALCNDTFSWVAVNVPFDALGKNGFEGDMDIVLAMHSGPPSPKNRVYRGFEVKAIPVSKDGVVTSQKKGPSKRKKIEKQVKKLRAFGCEQVFYLELYILERGFSRQHQFPTDAIQSEIAAKAKMLQELGCGYVYAIDEPVENAHEACGGIFFLVQNVLPTTNSKVTKHFSAMATRLERIYRRESGDFLSPHIQILSYCQKCKEVRMVKMARLGTTVCNFCESSMLSNGG